MIFNVQEMVFFLQEMKIILFYSHNLNANIQMHVVALQ